MMPRNSMEVPTRADARPHVHEGPPGEPHESGRPAHGKREKESSMLESIDFASKRWLSDLTSSLLPKPL
jgi:hypothetical protein